MDFRSYLTDNVLPFWLDNAIDEEYGGIFTCLDREGKIYGTEKSVWFQGRALWTFSTAYCHIEKNEKYIKAAKKIYDFLPRCEDKDGRMYFTVTREGGEIQKRRYYFSETFAAIGCAAYYKASGDREAWERAEKYFATAKKCYDDPSLNPPKTKLKLKAHSPVMIMMATARAMEKCAPEKGVYSALARSYADELLHGGFINVEIGALLENVSPDGSFANTPVGRTLNPGHALETAWFLMVEGVLENNREALDAAQRIVDFTMPRGLDGQHGGIIAFTDALGMPAGALEWDMKLWWPQNEAIIANRMAYQLFGDEKYNEAYKSLVDFAFSHFADNEYGEWYGYLHYDSTPSSRIKGNIFKGPFHLPRMLMILTMMDEGVGFDFFK